MNESESNHYTPNRKLSDEAIRLLQRGLLFRTRWGLAYLGTLVLSWIAAWGLVVVIILPVLFYDSLLTLDRRSLASLTLFVLLTFAYGKFVPPVVFGHPFYLGLCERRIEAGLRIQNLYRPVALNKGGLIGYPGLHSIFVAIQSGAPIRLYLRNFAMRSELISTKMLGGGFRVGSGFNIISAQDRQLEADLLAIGRDEYVTFCVGDVSDPTPPEGVFPLFVQDNQDWPIVVKELILHADSIIVLALTVREGIRLELDLIRSVGKGSRTKVYATPEVKVFIESNGLLTDADLKEVEDPEAKRRRLRLEDWAALNNSQLPLLDPRRIDAVLRLGIAPMRKEEVDLDFYEKFVLVLVLAKLLLG